MTAAVPTAHVPNVDRVIFAHRGLPSKAPENTVAAFDAARKAGATWFETDVDIIADGTPILIHDTWLDRTTDHSGKLYDLKNIDEVRAIDAGSWFGKEFDNEPIITLDEFIAYLNEHKINANIEIKQNEQGAERTSLLVDTVAKALEKLDDDIEIIISSFTFPLLMLFHQRYPQYAIGCLWETAALYEDWLTVAELCGASYIHPEDVNLTRERIQQFRDAGFGVNVWTVDSKDRANELLNQGCTGVFTNIADQLIHG